MSLGELVGVCVGAVTLVTAIGGGVAWLVWPRIADKIEGIARSVRAVEQATTNDDPDTISRHAKVAARAAAEIPELRAELHELADRFRAVDEWRNEIERRVGHLEGHLESIEQAMITLLAKELRARTQD